MKISSSSNQVAASAIALMLCIAGSRAQNTSPPAVSARELAGRMDAAIQGNALIRTKLEVRTTGGTNRVLQLQIKQRRTKTSADLAYQVLWPNEHKDEVVFLHQEAAKPARGSILIPHQPVRTIEPSQMKSGLFDSDLAYQDAIENVYAWKEQTIVGTEAVKGVNCQILESKPDNSSTSLYARVRSWIDLGRLVPLRIEKFSSSGELLRQIDITRVVRDQRHQPIPASLTVHSARSNSVTEFNGARIDQDVNFTDADFASPVSSRPD
jgi:hypothetical protein